MEKSDLEKRDKQEEEGEKETEDMAEEDREEEAGIEGAEEGGAVGSDEEEEEEEEEEYFEEQDDDFDEDEDGEDEDFIYQQEDDNQEDEDDINATPSGLQSQILSNSSSMASLQNFVNQTDSKSKLMKSTNPTEDSIRKSNLDLEEDLASKCVITDKNGRNLNNSSSTLDSVFSKATSSMLRGKGSGSGSQLSTQQTSKEGKGQQQ